MPHAEKRSTVDNGDANYFRERMRTPQEDYPPELVFKMDETCSRLFEAPWRVLEEMRKEIMKFRAARSEKTLCTAFGGINANWDKLPL
jgi:hypothetical protein